MYEGRPVTFFHPSLHVDVSKLQEAGEHEHQATLDDRGNMPLDRQTDRQTDTKQPWMIEMII